ncbi:MAG TPA: hypothetical protein VE734_01695 [Terriglobales bacterium]|nr:hypothetical protein [Terriglobales bacterium]
MNLSTILTELRAQKQALDEAIRALEGLSGNKQPQERAPRKRLHWTQRPENKAKVQRIMRAALKARKGKAA